jgi:hypothetical protein
MQMTTLTTVSTADVEQIKPIRKVKKWSDWTIVDVKSRGPLGVTIYLTWNKSKTCQLFKITYSVCWPCKKKDFNPEVHELKLVIGMHQPIKLKDYDELPTPQRMTMVSQYVKRVDGTLREEPAKIGSYQIQRGDKVARREVDKFFGEGCFSEVMALVASQGK